jgi:hypothetical protein
MLGSPDLDEAQRAAIIENLRAEANKLVDKLKTHFNVKN